MTITLEDLKLAIDNMYDQLDADKIDAWSVDGLEIYIDGTKYELALKEAA